jgi:hypothetical protein
MKPLLRPMKPGASGETALHLAALAGNAEAIKVLLEAGAEVEARADNGCAPLDYAIQRGSVTEAATVLGAAGAQLTPERLETMHAAAHSTETDLLMLPPEKMSGTIAQDKSPAAGQNEQEEKVTSAEPRAAKPREFRCPTCHALIYSRRPKICGQCGALLPPELVLSDEQARALKEQRSWAQELADQFSALPAFASKDRKDIKPSTPAAHFFAAELLQFLVSHKTAVSFRPSAISKTRG